MPANLASPQKLLGRTASTTPFCFVFNLRLLKKGPSVGALLLPTVRPKAGPLHGPSYGLRPTAFGLRTDRKIGAV